jgi:hypothetical protein
MRTDYPRIKIFFILICASIKIKKSSILLFHFVTFGSDIYTLMAFLWNDVFMPSLFNRQPMHSSYKARDEKSRASIFNILQGDQPCDPAPILTPHATTDMKKAPMAATRPMIHAMDATLIKGIRRTPALRQKIMLLCTIAIKMHGITKILIGTTTNATVMVRMHLVQPLIMMTMRNTTTSTGATIAAHQTSNLHLTQDTETITMITLLVQRNPFGDATTIMTKGG